VKRRTNSSNSRTKHRGDFSSDLYDQPGHLIRRAHQIAVSMFYSTVGPKVTPVQYAVLRILQDNPGIDQVTLAGLCALDTSTAANLAVRLEDRGLLQRMVPMKSRRFRLLHLTPQGIALVKKLRRSERRLSRRLLHELNQQEQKVLVRLLKKFVHLNNENSRAPLGRKSSAGKNNAGGNHG
jgi:MarR family transcriptional regulator, temperature-dependent positive regulator of motility